MRRQGCTSRHWWYQHLITRTLLMACWQLASDCGTSEMIGRTISVALWWYAIPMLLMIRRLGCFDWYWYGTSVLSLGRCWQWVDILATWQREGTSSKLFYWREGLAPYCGNFLSLFWPRGRASRLMLSCSWWEEGVSALSRQLGAMVSGLWQQRWPPCILFFFLIGSIGVPCVAIEAVISVDGGMGVEKYCNDKVGQMEELRRLGQWSSQILPKLGAKNGKGETLVSNQNLRRPGARTGKRSIPFQNTTTPAQTIYLPSDTLMGEVGVGLLKNQMARLPRAWQK